MSQILEVLPEIKSPADLRSLSMAQLRRLCDEIRKRIIEVVGKNGGHLASNLGVVELTVALHCVFDFAHDRLLWDVGHQAYPHKLLTGRNDRFDTLRKAGGISGFPSTQESPYDLFDVGHAGTAIATAVGMARAGLVQQDDRRVVALVGDASIVNGLAFEGLNQAGTLKRQFLVVLNDNSMGIAPTQGGFAEYLAKFRVSTLYEEVKRRAKTYLPQIPLIGRPTFEALDHLKEAIKASVSPHQIFEQMGFVYVGPTDGHDLEHLIELLGALKGVQHPVLLHVHTQKGKGSPFATAEPTRFHSPKPFNVEESDCGCKVTIQSGGRSYTAAFADALIEIARSDARVFAFTAAMPDGTGLNKFAAAFPDRYVDGGIAESGVVDQCAGMARAGLRPVAAIYSTFLQRAFDQVFQEVSLQGLPVLFCMDRAGLVGGDGAVHHGFLDIAYLRGFPGFVLMAPGDEAEISAAINFGLTLQQPAAIRYPRDNVPPPLGADCPPFVMGRSRVLRVGTDATLIAYGAMCRNALDAADALALDGISVSVVNARFAKPIDAEMLKAAFDGRPVLSIEDHSLSGGFGSAVLEAALDMRLPVANLTRLGMPAERFIAHGSRVAQLEECGLHAEGIAEAVRESLRSQPQSQTQAQPQATRSNSGKRAGTEMASAGS